MPKRVSEISSLRNLGKKSEIYLNGIGVYTRDDLVSVGVNAAYEKMEKKGYSMHPCMKYAMHGALADVHWTTVAREMKREG